MREPPHFRRLAAPSRANAPLPGSPTLRSPGGGATLSLGRPDPIQLTPLFSGDLLAVDLEAG
eukprot:2051356-Rhodomonas_salina.1